MLPAQDARNSTRVDNGSARRGTGRRAAASCVRSQVEHDSEIRTLLLAALRKLDDRRDA
jgi:hypothetical protein